MTAQVQTRARVLWPKIVRQEVSIRLGDKMFLITTLVMVLLIGGVFAFLALSNSGSDSDTLTVGTVGQASEEQISAVGETADTTEGDSQLPRIEGVRQESLESARKALLNGELDAVLSESDDGWTLLVNGSSDGPNATLLRDAVSSAQLVQNADQMGISITDLQQGTAVAVEDASAQEGISSSLQQMLALGFGLIFYMAVVLFGTGIAQSVVGEKESRIIEILAAMVPLWQLLIGKIIGTSLVAFIQIALFAGAAAVGLQFVDVGIDLSSLTTALLWFIPFFAIGFLALACVWAIAGSMAARTEDLQSTSLPLTLGLALVLFAPMLFEGQWLVGASYVPLFSSVLMPVRALAGDLVWWEPVIALALVLLFCILCLLIGDRLYRKSVMHTSSVMTWSKMFSKSTN